MSHQPLILQTPKAIKNRNQRALRFKGLSDKLFSVINLRSETFTSDHIRLSFWNKFIGTFCAYSLGGLLQSKKGAYFLKLESHRIDENSTMIPFLKDVMAYSYKVFENYTPGFTDTKLNKPSCIVSNPLKDEGPVVIFCAFPGKYTKYYEIIKGKPPVETNVHRLVNTSGNSQFIVECSVNASDLELSDNTITVQTYININSVTWIDEGQDVKTQLAEAFRLQEEKEFTTKKNIYELYNQVCNKKQKVELEDGEIVEEKEKEKEPSAAKANKKRKQIVEE